MKGTWVQSLGQEDSRCCGTTEPMHHDKRRSSSTTMEKSPYSLQLEKAHSQPQRHSATKTAAAAKSLQSCPTLCDPRDGSPPGFPVPGILQARTLEWVAISFSSECMKVKSERSCSVVSSSLQPHGRQPTRLLHPCDFPGKSTGVGCHRLLHT